LGSSPLGPSPNATVILGLDPRIQPNGALNADKQSASPNPILGSSPRMTAGEEARRNALKQ
jgi:hypothetical protein